MKKRAEAFCLATKRLLELKRTPKVFLVASQNSFENWEMVNVKARKSILVAKQHAFENRGMKMDKRARALWSANKMLLKTVEWK